jgi:hypothetical protein
MPAPQARRPHRLAGAEVAVCQASYRRQPPRVLPQRYSPLLAAIPIAAATPANHGGRGHRDGGATRPAVGGDRRRPAVRGRRWPAVRSGRSRPAVRSSRRQLAVGPSVPTVEGGRRRPGDGGGSCRPAVGRGRWPSVGGCPSAGPRGRRLQSRDTAWRQSTRREPRQ